MDLAPLIGHRQVVSQLKALLEGGRLPHALLLHGPRGVGKRVVAEHLAWRLICGPALNKAVGEGAFGFDATVPQAAQLAAGSCPDFHVLAPVEGKKSISREQVDQLLQVLRRTADTQRVVVVDSIDELSLNTPNLLLKALEEPRPGITFILLSHQLGGVLPTIRSRCRLLRFTPLGSADALAVKAAHPAEGKESRDDLDALLRELAETPDFGHAEAYRKISLLRQKQKEMNLPVALAVEAGRGLVKT
jgi:DNA polymerase-3 subunit delta'